MEGPEKSEKKIRMINLEQKNSGKENKFPEKE
jgi:hypothetical protein